MATKVNPPIEPMEKHEIKTDFEIFAKAYFGIELTSYQVEVIEAIASGKTMMINKRRAGLNKVNEMIKSYIGEGIKKDGRMRMPSTYTPHREKLKNKTQSGKILELIKQPRGAFNFELSRISLKYDARIHELREEGHNIIAERQYLKNGRASNTWKYYIAGQL